MAVASSTLEIGIDIGDIDLVVLDGPPPDVSSLLQRIGRGNRRRATTRVLPCWNNEGEQVILNAMLLAAKAGDLGAPVSGKQFAVARRAVGLVSPSGAPPPAQSEQLGGDDRSG